MIRLALLLALQPFVASAALAQSGRAPKPCEYHINNSLLYKFDCRMIFSGDFRPSKISFIDNHKSGERYLVGKDRRLLPTDLDGFKYVGGKCISLDFSNIKVCWN